MRLSRRIHNKVVKYAIILKALGIINADDYNQITCHSSSDKQNFLNN